MRVQHIRQLATGLATKLPSHAAATAIVRRELDCMRLRLWHGDADSVDDCIDRLAAPIGAFRRYPPKRRIRETLSGLWTALYDLRRYVCSNAHLLIDYASHQQAGETISTARVESAVNNLVNRRMNKSQQMRWSANGAHHLLQVRAAVINGDFDPLVRPSADDAEAKGVETMALAA